MEQWHGRHVQTQRQQSAVLREPPSVGFTLVELVFVMVILGVLLMAAVPRFAHTTERLRVERTASELTQLLRYAHERAVAEGREIVWHWQQDTHRVQLETIDGKPLQERLTMSGLIPSTLSIVLEQDGNAVDRVSFLPDGTSQHTTIDVTQGADAYTVIVDEATGQAVLSARSAPR